MSHPLFAAAPRSTTFAADAKCPEGYVLVSSAPSGKPKSGFRPYTHLAHYESVSAMARGVIAATAHTLCGLGIPRHWSFEPRTRDDGTAERTTCPKCLTAIRRALA